LIKTKIVKIGPGGDMALQRLGRGLEALIRQTEEVEEVVSVSVDSLSPNTVQPREKMDGENLSELAVSIKEVGLLQPLIARRVQGNLQIVVGERRWRAAKMAGLTNVPVIVKEMDENKALQLAIVENLQREDLNPIEKARAFRDLIDAMQLTQEEAARKLGIGRSVLANTVRLLELPTSVKDLVCEGELSQGHAKVLLSAAPALRESLADRVVNERLSVRELETLILGISPKRTRRRRHYVNPPEIRVLEEELSELLCARVTVRRKGALGKISIHFFSPDEFDSTIDIIRRGAESRKQVLTTEAVTVM
jgi:ParB family chromosome partitioning protein